MESLLLLYVLDSLDSTPRPTREMIVRVRESGRPKATASDILICLDRAVQKSKATHKLCGTVSYWSKK